MSDPAPAPGDPPEGVSDATWLVIQNWLATLDPLGRSIVMLMLETLPDAAPMAGRLRSVDGGDAT